MKFSSEKGNLLTDIFLLHLETEDTSKTDINFLSKHIISTSELNKLKSLSMIPIFIDEYQITYYIFFNEKTYNYLYSKKLIIHTHELSSVNEKEEDLVLPFFNTIIEKQSQLLEMLTMKKFTCSISEGKTYDFQNLPIKRDDSIFGYFIFCSTKFDIDIKFGFYFPLKALSFFTSLFNKVNLINVNKKAPDVKTAKKNILHEIKKLRIELYRKRVSFPFDIIDFFNDISDRDLQQILTLFLSNKMITHDMLYVLAVKIEDGLNRIVRNVSRNLQSEFMENLSTKAKNINNRWIAVALHQIALNLDVLLKEQQISSPYINRFQQLIEQLTIYQIEKVFTKRSYANWLQYAEELKLLSYLIPKCNDLTLSRSLANEEDSTIEIIERNMTKRGFSFLIEDVDYVAKNISYTEELRAKYNVIETLIENIFDNNVKDKTNLIKWIERIPEQNDLNYVVQYCGPIEFFLALKSIKGKERREIIHHLYTPLNYYIEDLFSGNVKVNFPYGEQRLKEAIANVIKDIYTLEQKGEIKLTETD